MTDVGVKAPPRGLLVPRQRQRRSAQDVLDRGDDRTAPVLAPAAAESTATVLVPAQRRAPAAPGPAPAGRVPEVVRLMAADVAAGSVTAVAAWELGAVAALLAVPAMAASGLQRRRFSPSVLDDAPRILRSSAFVLTAFLLVCVAGAVSLTQVLVAYAVYVAAAIACRALAYRWIRTVRRDGDLTYPVLLVGDEEGELARRIAEHPETGLRVVGNADVTGTVCHPDGSTETVGTVMARDQVTDVIVHPVCAGPETSAWVRRVAWRAVALHLIVPEVGAAPRRGWDDHVWGVPVLRMQTALHWRRARVLKRLTDVAVSFAALVALTPVLLVVAALVRREVGPGILFRQERVGLDGRTFDVLKFRSMRNLPPGVTSPWSVTSSDRIGPVGRFIRHYSLDELPQLWNVLKGDMSLVGPRPERPEYVSRFSEEFPHYQFRHRAPVGLTGLAAVEGLRGNTSIHDRAYFDNLYVESWSYWADVKIIARTVLAVARGTGS